MVDLDVQIQRQREQLAELERKAAEEAALRAVREAQTEARRTAAIEAHQALELEHADELAALREELNDARSSLGKAAASAIEALCGAWDEAQRYNTLVAATADDLRDAGLLSRWEEADVAERFDTGACTSLFRGPSLLLSGTPWCQVHPRLVAAYVLEAVVAGRVPGAGDGSRQGPAVDLLDPVTKRPKPVPAPQVHMAALQPVGDWNAPVIRDGKARYQGAAKG